MTLMLCICNIMNYYYNLYLVSIVIYFFNLTTILITILFKILFYKISNASELIYYLYKLNDCI